jgi:hypothetical protein
LFSIILYNCANANVHHCRLRAAGLLPLARLVEGDGRYAAHKTPRFNYDFSLLAALVDRWRPETHTFHLPVGEMAPTLQDVSFLLGLPLSGQAMGPTDVHADWSISLLGRFATVQRREGAQQYREFPANSSHGPPKWWLLQFTVSTPSRVNTFRLAALITNKHVYVSILVAGGRHA